MPKWYGLQGLIIIIIIMALPRVAIVPVVQSSLVLGSRLSDQRQTQLSVSSTCKIVCDCTADAIPWHMSVHVDAMA
jgi:hypothetical protein